MPTPPKPVHPTPIPVSGCRGCTDAMTDKSPAVKGYDDRSVDSTRKKAPPPPKKATPKRRTTKHSAAKPKVPSKAHARKAAVAKQRPVYKDKPAVLDPMIPPRATVTTKAKSDTTRK